MIRPYLPASLTALVLAVLLLTAPARSQLPAPSPTERVVSVLRAIEVADPSEEVANFLYDGHWVIMGEEGRARFDKALRLFQKGLHRARVRREPNSAEIALRLIAETKRAIYRYGKDETEARRDIQRGRFIEKQYGLPPPPSPWDDILRKTLRQEYGIETVGVADCEPTYEQLAEVDGYNRISIPAREKRYGKDMIARVTKEVEQRWKREHPERTPDPVAASEQEGNP